VQSEPGVGSRFEFALDFALQQPAHIPAPRQALTTKPHTPDPRPTASRPAPVRPAAIHVNRLRGMRVLVVEDSPINQQVMQQLLENEGANVAVADNGQLGVDALRASLTQQAFDVVLMDIQMPVMDGYQATRTARLLPGLQQLPIIAVSANVQASDRAQSLASGMNAHIGKPYALDELVALIQRLTRWAHAMPAAAPSATLQAKVPALHVYWILGDLQQPRPDALRLLQQNLVLHLLDSVAALAEQMVNGSVHCGLLVADLECITSESMGKLVAQGNGASMKDLAMLVLADAVTEAEMQACIRCGAVDMVPLPYALEQLEVIARKHINARGELRVDTNNKVVAIDAWGAMQRMQSDPAFFGSLLRAFFDELPLRRQLLAADWSLDPVQVKHRSHALKGLALTLGLASLATVASEAEHRSAHATADAGLLLRLEGEMRSASFHILRWLSLHPECTVV